METQIIINGVPLKDYEGIIFDLNDVIKRDGFSFTLKDGAKVYKTIPSKNKCKCRKRKRVKNRTVKLKWKP